MTSRAGRCAALLGALLPWSAAVAQGGAVRWRVGGQAVPALTAAAPTPRDRGTAVELRVAHPVLMIRAETRTAAVGLVATANAEGWTLRHGALAPGAWGEGFVDRRHPHTYLHELMLVLRGRAGPLDAVLAGGKGFVPFGTDDPMSRAPVVFPVNHHLSQILERAVALAGVAGGPLLAEVAAFNGDEPEGPGGWPNFARFGDSWSVRLTLWPGGALELQASHAAVRSPEHRPGTGPLDQKWSASARWSGALAGAPAYALIEWAHTGTADGPFRFRTALAEAAIAGGVHRPYLRLERTERPEEERASDYRTVRPPHDDALLGITRWTTMTVGYALGTALGRVRIHPFVEASLGRIAAVSGGFDPATFYGTNTLKGLTVGVRLAAGMDRHRMGRYADPPAGDHHH